MDLFSKYTALISQLLVLTTRKRSLESFNGFTVVEGIDAHDFKTEADMMSQTQIPMLPKWRQEWLRTDFGYGPIHGNKSPQDFPAGGALACSLGHHHMWQ